jgi:hypothetical protein
MRAAYELERETLAGAAEKAGSTLSVLFVYKGGRDPKPAPFRFEPVREDMSSLCRTLCLMAEKERM